MKRPPSREVLAIPLAKIKMAIAHPPIDEGHAQMIAASMAALGPVTPIEVREADQDGCHLLVAGRHRYRAAQLAGIPCLPAIVHGEAVARAPESGLRILDSVGALEECLPDSRASARIGAWTGDFPIRSE